MKKTYLIGIVVIVVMFSLTACSNSTEQASTTTSSSDKSLAKIKASGGEELHSVRAEYSFCYATDNPDPTLRSKCEDQITYEECKDWQGRIEGSSNTFFYAVFSGGEPTIPGRTANYYRMKVMYGENLEQISGEQAVFKDIESEFMLYDQSGCYPKATIEILNADDEVMGRKSFDYEK